jgi:hypothetical protein
MRLDRGVAWVGLLMIGAFLYPAVEIPIAYLFVFFAGRIAGDTVHSFLQGRRQRWTIEAWIAQRRDWEEA